jgi:predicted amidohydrolase YtcJ
LVFFCYGLPLWAQSPPEIIFCNGKIIAVDQTFSYQETLAIRDGRILDLGSNQEIEELAGRAAASIGSGA